MNSKKAALLHYFVIAGFIAGFIVFHTTSLSSQPEIERFIGEPQLGLIKISQEAQKYLFYIDQATKISADQAMLDLTKKGGFALKSPCGEYKEYPLWTTLEEKCYPDYMTEFKALLNTNINNYLKKLPSGETINKQEKVSFYPIVPEIDYEFFIKENQIIGIADQEIKITMFFENPKTGEYSVKPSFNIKTKFNLNDFQTLKEQAEELIGKCAGNPDKLQCVKENKPENWGYTQETPFETEDTNPFRFSSRSETPISGYELTPIYRFALTIP